MRYRFRLEGPAYSRHKESLKRLLAKHGLRWRGDREAFVWAGTSERVIATYERDPQRDVTLSAELVWESRKKTEFLEDLKEWVWSVGGEGGQDETGPPTTTAKALVERELAVWDVVHKPDATRLRAEGRPDAWIQRDLREWKRRRDERRRELMAELGGLP